MSQKASVDDSPATSNNNDETVSTSAKSKSTMPPAEATAHIDTLKLACLLCKRRFESLDILNKHVAKSDLHKVWPVFFFFFNKIIYNLVDHQIACVLIDQLGQAQRSK